VSNLHQREKPDDAERIANTKVVGAAPMWEWAGTDTTVFSY
jgi:hypothetical protein